MKNFNIFGVHGKIPVLGGAYEKPICRGGLPEKEGAWTVFRFKAGLARKREVVDTSMHTMVTNDLVDITKTI